MPRPVPRYLIEDALSAHDDGFRIIANWLNSDPVLKQASVTIVAGSPHPGTTIEQCRNRLINSFLGVRQYATDVESDLRKIYPWTLGRLNRQKPDLHLISLYWSEGTETLEEEIERLVAVCHSYGWTSEDWQKCVKEQVERYARDWRSWLNGLAETGESAVAISNEPDGPFGQQQFRWMGTKCEGIALKPFKLIELLWNAPDRTLTVDNAETAIYGQRAQNADGLRSLRREVNRFFRNNGVPLHVKISDKFKGHVALRDGHPTNRRVKNPRKSF